MTNALTSAIESKVDDFGKRIGRRGGAKFECAPSRFGRPVRLTPAAERGLGRFT